MELEAGIGGFPGCLRSQQQRHVRFGATGLMGVEQCTRFEAHQVGGLHFDVRLGDRELHSLILADRPAEYIALVNVFRHLVNEPVAVADALGRDERPLRIEPVENVSETLPFFAN